MKLQSTIKASSILGLLLTRSAQASFYVCTLENFAGNCQLYELPYDDCYTFDRPFVRTVVSAGPDKTSWCTLYANPGCTGDELNLHYPGLTSLGAWNNKAASFNCAAE
ncbi:hypothetical protein N0V85_009601 [Neurospora sp. IMI 360204]|nr:hypothetical protein N0V85_009601 [Neurospora sp. IMI 360204]